MRLSDVSKSRDNNFNLIRIMAAFAVLLSHSFPLSGVKAEPLESVCYMTMGRIAVDIFFVTSGFLVTGSLLNSSSLIEYFCARGLRIFPALWTMLFLVVFGFGLLFTSDPHSVYLSSKIIYQYILKNSILITGVLYMLPGVFKQNPYKGSVNGSIWSMVWEVRFYVLIALIWSAFFFVKKSRETIFAWVMLFLAATSGLWRIISHFHDLPFNTSTSLFFMFFSGGCFYLFREKIKLSWVLFLISIIALGVSLHYRSVFLSIYDLSIAYLLLFVAYVPSGFIRIYNRLGDCSYGMYIYAFPVQQSAAALFPGLSWVKMVLISAPVAFLLAILSWHLIEKKALKLKTLLRGKVGKTARW